MYVKHKSRAFCTIYVVLHCIEILDAD